METKELKLVYSFNQSLFVIGLAVLMACGGHACVERKSCVRWFVLAQAYTISARTMGNRTSSLNDCEYCWLHRAVAREGQGL